MFCLPLPTSVSPPVARTVQRRASKVLRAGPEGATASHATVPRLVCAGQLCRCSFFLSTGVCRDVLGGFLCPKGVLPATLNQALEPYTLRTPGTRSLLSEPQSGRLGGGWGKGGGLRPGFQHGSISKPEFFKEEGGGPCSVVPARDCGVDLGLCTPYCPSVRKDPALGCASVFSARVHGA